MSKKIRIRIKDFYKDTIGEIEYTYVSEEVYEALANIFRKEAHAEQIRDLRHVTEDGYVEGDTEDLLMEVEDYVIRQLEIKQLQKAMQQLTENQKERLQLYFFEGLTYRQIGERLGVDEKAVRNGISVVLKKF